jgi:hypothetical protein
MLFVDRNGSPSNKDLIEVLFGSLVFFVQKLGPTRLIGGHVTHCRITSCIRSFNFRKVVKSGERIVTVGSKGRLGRCQHRWRLRPSMVFSHQRHGRSRSAGKADTIRLVLSLTVKNIVFRRHRDCSVPSRCQCSLRRRKRHVLGAAARIPHDWSQIVSSAGWQVVIQQAGSGGNVRTVASLRGCLRSSRACSSVRKFGVTPSRCRRQARTTRR